MTAAEKQLHSQFSFHRRLSAGDFLTRSHKIILIGIVFFIAGYVFLINNTLGGRYVLKDLAQQTTKLEQQQNELRRNLDIISSLEAINVAGSSAGFTDVTLVKYLQLAGASAQKQKLAAQR
ncbi:MAG: hypothetical protein HYV65_02115 [Candidatus Spechtbacteria bacterium]|nr:hypothetical protein [Candidatus Spechtbacteria bacterium]